ncbi:galectin-4-like [Dermatophagoides pteronyssinus]|nr:lymphatic endothelial cell migration [Dermatophagoides pteronyssinus]
MDSILKKSKKLIDSVVTLPANKNSKSRYLSLNEGLTQNTRIWIEGKVNPAASRFEINLWCASVVSEDLVKNGDIAMHFCVHPSAGYALLNSRTGKTWGQEERTPRGRLPRPLLQNQNFRLCIEAEPKQYRIDVNDNEFVTFIHRHPFESVGLLSYEGDFEVENIFIQPPPAMVSHPLAEDSHIVNDLKWPKLPLLLPINSGLQIGMIFTIDGRVTGNRFDISLYQGSNPYEDPNANVPFHMEIYMDSKAILRNSYQQKQWCQPEKELTHFPFFGHSAFNLQIRVEGNRYQVSVGGRYVYDFYHRISALSTINHLCIHGGVEIHSLIITIPPLQ